MTIDIEQLRAEANDAQVRFYGTLVELGLEDELDCDPRTRLSVPIVDVRSLIRHGNFCHRELTNLQERADKLAEVIGGLLEAMDAVDAEAQRAEKKGGGWSSAPVIRMHYKRQEARAALATYKGEAE